MTHTANEEAAWLHILGDLLNSAGVVIAAVIIMYYPNLWYFDPICTYVFSIITMFTTIPAFHRNIKVMLDLTPDHINTDEIKAQLENIPGVAHVHDLHLWSIS